MGPPALCGSYSVYGGWVGGPGRESDVRLVSRDLHLARVGGIHKWHVGAVRCKV